jgi:hypothetical protein
MPKPINAKGRVPNPGSMPKLVVSLKKSDGTTDAKTPQTITDPNKMKKWKVQFKDVDPGSYVVIAEYFENSVKKSQSSRGYHLK